MACRINKWAGRLQHQTPSNCYACCFCPLSQGWLRHLFFFLPPSPLSNIFSVNRGNRPEEQQSHRRLAEVVFPYSHASACLDSSGIWNKEADQEGLAGPLSSLRVASAPRRALPLDGVTERLFIVPQPNLSQVYQTSLN